MNCKAVFVILSFLISSLSSVPAGNGTLDYNRDIRPILSDKCYACHGPDNNKRKAGLRLDRNEEPFKKVDSGKIAIVPGKPRQSELVHRITTADEDEKMPPASSKQLTKTETDLLIRWIKEGAEWKGHWSYIPPQFPELPKIKNRKWVRNAIDHFIVARLEKEGLKPSREADKARLIRRVTLDLTGLPPTIEEVDAFLADKSFDAYEKLVDRLLASPAFGERMAQVWLDVARYADTNGYHIDNHRDMWAWRNWVISAFNKNMSFDQFTIEQLAGDMLPNVTEEQKIASGFNRNNMVNFEGGADPNEYATKYVVDRVSTTSTTWLGVTMACAECHDHKYDPFTQKEFYQLYALFNNIPENGLDGRTENPVPSMKVPSSEQKAKKKQLEQEISSLEKTLEQKITAPDAEHDAAQEKWVAKFKTGVLSGWTVPEHTNLEASGGVKLSKLDDFSVLAGDANPEKTSYEITLKTPFTNITGIRLEALADETLPQKKSGRAENGNFVLTTFEVEAKNPAPQDANIKPEPVKFGTWHMLGPFKFGSVRQAYARAGLDEKATRVNLTATHNEDTLKWVAKPEWKDGVVQNFETGDYYAYYVHRAMTVNSARQILVSLGSDDGIQVWLNGKKIHANDTARGADKERDKVILWLDPGENHLLMKISNGTGAVAYFFEADENPPEKFPVLLTSAVADYSQKDLGAKAALDRDAKTGWGVLDAPGTNQQAIFSSSQAFGFPSGTILKVRMKFESDFKQHAIGKFRLAISTSEALTELNSLPVKLHALVFKDSAKYSKAERAELKEYYRTTYVPAVAEIDHQIRVKKETLSKLEAEIPSTMVMQEMEKPRDTFLLVRGDFRSKGEKVSPAVPKILFDGPPEGMPTNRLQFARWLVSTNHPLTARVTVNRFWQMFFGTGLVKSANDFGSQGEWPSHPELLDWLASEFMAKNWDMKHLLKLMVTSSTYRQESKVTPELLERDAYNRLLTRGPRFRMDAEMIRDNALAASGLLNRKIGGESVRPYQPPGLWEAVSFGAGFSSQSYAQSKGDDLYRRGLYVYWKRSLPYPSMVTFDAPNRELCTAARPRTTTPLQALVVMNDPVYVEAARHLAQRVLEEGGANLEQQLTYAFRLTLARSPDKKEIELLTRIFREQLDNYRKDTEAAKALVSAGESARPENLDVSELAAWTAIGNILLNLDETITKG